MSDLTHSFSAGQTIVASQINQVLLDLNSLIHAVGNNQLVGGITANKLIDRHALSWMHYPIVSRAPTGDFATPVGLVLPAAETELARISPVIKPGFQCYLCAIVTHVIDYDVGGTDNPKLNYKRNGTTKLGGADLTLDTDQARILIGSDDPIADSVTALDDGDYVQINLWGPTGSPAPAGVDAYFAFKHILVP